MKGTRLIPACEERIVKIRRACRNHWDSGLRRADRQDPASVPEPLGVRPAKTDPSGFSSRTRGACRKKLGDPICNGNGKSAEPRREAHSNRSPFLWAERFWRQAPLVLDSPSLNGNGLRPEKTDPSSLSERAGIKGFRPPWRHPKTRTLC